MATTARRADRTYKALSATPLGIIAIFVALSETIAGLAAVQTGGAVQLIFCLFAVLFPVLVATLFFLVLWSRSYVFYPPQEFGMDVNVTQYVEAMRHQAIGNQELLSLVQTSIKDTFRSGEAQIELSRVAKDQTVSKEVALQNASTVLAEKAVGRLQQSVLRIDISAFAVGTAGPLPELVFAYDAKADAFELLSSIYYQISDHVPAFTYGKVWALEDLETKQLILPSNVNWRDNRALADSGATVEQFGLQAGMALRAIELIRHRGG